jgi:hypothetical protein
VKQQFDFIFQNIQPLEEFSKLEEKNWLWILHSDKIPPHIGISSEGKYYSLKVNGKDNGIPVNQVLQLLEKKRIKSILVSLNLSLSSSILIETFSEYDKAKGKEISCLSPIKRCVLPNTSANKLSELLHFLHQQGKLADVFGLHLTNGTQGILHYEPADIEKRIALLNVKRK